MIKAKFFKLLALVFVTFSLVFITSCGKDDGDDPTDQELAIEALTTGTWTIDAATSTAGTGIDVSTIGVTFSGSSTITVGFTGEITDYVSGGSFTVAEDGSITGVSVTRESEDISVIESSVGGSINSTLTTVTIEFDTEASAARTSGVGAFSLKFNKAS